LARALCARRDDRLTSRCGTIESTINQLFLRDLPRLIAEAKLVHDQFLSMVLVLRETAGDVTLLPEEVAHGVNSIRNRATDFPMPFDHDDATAATGRWEAARKALRESATAPLPD